MEHLHISHFAAENENRLTNRNMCVLIYSRTRNAE